MRAFRIEFCFFFFPPFRRRGKMLRCPGISAPSRMAPRSPPPTFRRRSIPAPETGGGRGSSIPPGDLSERFAVSQKQRPSFTSALGLRSSVPSIRNDYPHRLDAPSPELKWTGLPALINVPPSAQRDHFRRGNDQWAGATSIFWPLYWRKQQEYTEKGLRWVVDYDVGRPVPSAGFSIPSKLKSEISTSSDLRFGTCHILYSKNVHVDGLTIRNNIDGVPEREGVWPRARMG